MQKKKLQADVLCVLRYEPGVDLSTGQGVKGGEGPEDGDQEDGEQVATGEVPGKFGTTGRAVLPANCRNCSLLEVQQ